MGSLRRHGGKEIEKSEQNEWSVSVDLCWVLPVQRGFPLKKDNFNENQSGYPDLKDTSSTFQVRVTLFLPRV